MLMKRFLNSWGLVVLLIFFLVYSCDVQDKVRKLRKDVRELKGDSVRLSPGSNGYQVIHHQLGSATISLEEIKAHDQGGSIILEIGNLTSVDITGVTMKISYLDSSDGSVERSWLYDVKQTLEAGKTTKVTLILEGVNPSVVAYIRISDFQPSGISLLQAN